jgi:L-threonylcarbamoyladenylate synthase
MLASHYAPRARLRLNADAPGPDEVYLGFGAHAHGPHTLSARGDVEEAAAALYAMLRALDATGAAAIAVAPIPRHGLGEAINDRLRRAAVR